VYNSGGHSAEVRSVLFTGDGRILTAGLDKSVRVWKRDTDGIFAERTLRPLIWRGPRGAIYTMALSRVQDNGQAILAVAGYGVAADYGNITLFRYPGRADLETGDIFASLPSSNMLRVTGGAAGNQAGHANSVTSLVFTPNGKGLASADLDGQILVWNLEDRKPIVLPREHAQGATHLAFSGGRDGKPLLLWSGGADGIVRVREVVARGNTYAAGASRAIPLNVAGEPPENDAIEALALEGDTLVVGQEGGYVTRIDARTFVAHPLVANQDRRGPIEAVALSPDGNWLATSAIARRPDPRRPDLLPPVGCVVELWRLPNGPRKVIQTTTNRVRACAFSPDSKILAFAGGDEQALFVVKDLSRPETSVVALHGEGSSIWEVGFAQQGIGVGMGRIPPGTGPVSPELEGFDFEKHEIRTYRRAELKFGSRSWGNWRVQADDAYNLRLLDPQGTAYRITLERNRDGRWWDYAMIPPVEGHRSGPVVAVGCESGVSFFIPVAVDRLCHRTRLYAAHSGAVLSLAPSPDGSGSPRAPLTRPCGCGGSTAVTLSRLWAPGSCPRATISIGRCRSSPTASRQQAG
jgi:WD40 repeat protein